MQFTVTINDDPQGGWREAETAAMLAQLTDEWWGHLGVTVTTNYLVRLPNGWLRFGTRETAEDAVALLKPQLEYDLLIVPARPAVTA